MGDLPEVNKKEYLVLTILAEAWQEGKNELYGLEIVERSKGVLRRGSIYVLLHRLEEEDRVASRKEDRPAYEKYPRRLYRLTDTGRRAKIQKEQEKGETLPDGFCPA